MCRLCDNTDSTALDLLRHDDRYDLLEPRLRQLARQQRKCFVAPLLLPQVLTEIFKNDRYSDLENWYVSLLEKSPTLMDAILTLEGLDQVGRLEHAT